MQKASGVLRTLGNSTVTSSNVAYTVIEIGEEVLQKVDIPKPLDNFLRHGLESAEKTTLHLVGRTILGVETPDGRRYFTNMSSRLRRQSITMIVFAVIFALSGLVSFREGGFLFLLLGAGLGWLGMKTRVAGSRPLNGDPACGDLRADSGESGCLRWRRPHPQASLATTPADFAPLRSSIP
jgi:hypothetical protein